MIFFRAIRYLEYKLFWQHRNGHGIHSPFVFDLISRVFRNKINPDIVCKIESIRKNLISDNSTLAVRDLGSGSENTKTNLRRVSDIARYSPVQKKYGFLLSNMAIEFGAPFIIEFGTSFGISTMYLAGESRNVIVYTMEGCPAISEKARENFEETGFSNIRMFTGSFDDLLPSIMNLPGTPGLIFIDGNHRKDPVINYFCRMREISGDKTVIILDDIHYSLEMEEAWEIIKHSEKVTMTIDIGRMGIVFFRKGMTHIDYKIRY